MKLKALIEASDAERSTKQLLLKLQQNLIDKIEPHNAGYLVKFTIMDNAETVQTHCSLELDQTLVGYDGGDFDPNIWMLTLEDHRDRVDNLEHAFDILSDWQAS